MIRLEVLAVVSLLCSACATNEKSEADDQAPSPADALTSELPSTSSSTRPTSSPNPSDAPFPSATTSQTPAAMPAPPPTASETTTPREPSPVNPTAGSELPTTPTTDAVSANGSPAAGSANDGGGTSEDAGGDRSSEGGSGGELPGRGAGGGSTESAGGAAGGSADTEPAPPGPLTVYIAGDSTVSTYTDTPSTTDQAGWGQMLDLYYDPNVTIDNRAIGGRTARRFIDEGRLAEIDAVLQPGDYLLVQFGTNDGHATATYEINGQIIPYYLDPDTDFKDYLGQYLDVANAHDATLVYVTPPPRNSAYCTGGNGTGAHAQAMRDLAEEESVALSDLNKKTVAYLTAICPAPTPEDFFLLRDDGTVDGTHFQENGARILARFVADGISEAGLPLALLGR